MSNNEVEIFPYEYVTEAYCQKTLFQDDAQNHGHSGENSNLKKKLGIQSSSQGSVLCNLSSHLEFFTNTG